ncbi:ChaN family lipoprotein [Diaphorobacter sp.]|uniref:ChaN family lipoprotein n=2 Tax=Pseudomonadota TaxID=1224 RepID=UPI0025831BF3|nr:ChaN family lipoprotein [Diaphorobacter sp.]
MIFSPLVRLLLTALALVWIAGCTTPPEQPQPTSGAETAWDSQLERWPPVDALLLGEQHDAAAHQQWQRHTVQWLAARQRLAALVLEMAPEGAGTDGLPPDADAAQVRAALQWDEQAWPWDRYAPVVMAAVAAGVPVRGGNLPRSQMPQAMRDAALDTHLPPAALAAVIDRHDPVLVVLAGGAAGVRVGGFNRPRSQRPQALRAAALHPHRPPAALARPRTAIEEGHCGLVPAQRLMPMVRIQLARDARMARAVQAAHRPGRTVLLVAGFGHVQRSLGVPTWLPSDFTSKVAIAQAGQARAAIESEADYVHRTPALTPHDPCAELRERWSGPPSAP